MTTATAVLIGVGNEYRRDDGAAGALLARIAADRPAGLDLLLSDGDPSSLLDAWDGRDLAIVVDAVLCDPSTPGRVHRTAEPAMDQRPAGGSHALGIPDAVRLGRVLGRLPRRMVVYAVEAADLGFGIGLTHPVAAALPHLERAVRADLSGTTADS